MANITVVGAGMMGSALCVPFVDAGHRVRLVGTHLDEAIVTRIQKDHFHPKLGVALPSDVEAFQHTEIERAMADVDAIGLGVSSAGVQWAASTIAPFATGPTPVVMVTKGLEAHGGVLKVLPDVLAETFAGTPSEGVDPVGIAGPCIAGELAHRVQTSVVFAGRDADAVARLRSLASTPYYHVHPTADVIGAEVSAALKNAYALGIALASGIHEQKGGAAGSVAMHNYESAVFAQSVVEMQRIIGAVGGNPATATGLAGVGDLDVTCNGGRTGRFGRWLGLGLGLREAIEKMDGATLECIDILTVMRGALPSLEAQGAAAATDMPLLAHLCEVVLEGRPVAMPFDRFFGSNG